VIWQDGSARRYHQEDGHWPQAVSGITDEAGVRYGSYAYDAQGRVTRSELSGGAERLDFAYSSDGNGQPTTSVTDYTGPGGAATTRSYTFTDIGNVRYPSSLTAPCSLCGSTQQASTYDANGNPTKQIAHDSSVTFYKYDAQGRETERATFPSSYQSATTRPALSAATKVISTKWHATFNLPTQLAEPNKTTANTYNAKGMLTGQSWTATTDATGAAKFTAAKTGSTYATGYGYNANNLITSLVSRETPSGSTAATEISRWTATYSASGDVATETKKYTAANPPRANEITKYTSRTPDGLPLRIVTADGKTVTLTYKPRAMVNGISIAATGVTTTRTQFFYNALARPTEVLLPDNSRVVFEYAALGRLNAVSDTAGNKFQYSFTTDGSIQDRLDTGNAVALDQRVLAAYDPLGWAIAGTALPLAAASLRQAPLSSVVSAPAGATTQNASVADSLVLSTSKAKRASCIAACVAAGTFAGSAGGRFVGGAIGGTAGGVLGTALPGVGTAAVGTAGAIAGGAGGARAGAWAGSLGGAAVAAAICPADEEECEKKLAQDGDLCVAVAGARYGRRGVAICQSAAMQRYAECLRFGVGGIRTPLTGVDTPI
jgi:YD repeat-containing protein